MYRPNKIYGCFLAMIFALIFVLGLLRIRAWYQAEQMSAMDRLYEDTLR